MHITVHISRIHHLEKIQNCSKFQSPSLIVWISIIAQLLSIGRKTAVRRHSIKYETSSKSMIAMHIQGGPTKVVPTVTSKNVSWYNFSWATLY